MKEFNNISFFEKAFFRALQITDIDNIFVVTNKDYKFFCMNQSNIPEQNIIIETLSKNTMWAISLWIDSWEDDDVFVVLSSDHIIKEDDFFTELIKNNIKEAKKSIITFWIKPKKAHTWYWYIDFKKEWVSPYQVINFKEKPNEEKAKEYIEKWYYWNAWIFMFSKKVFIDELKKNNPEYYEIIKDWVLSNFHLIPDISIDYWLLEKTDNIKIVLMDIYWNDLGWFEAFDEYFSENNIKNDFIQIWGKNNLLIETNSKKEIVCIWIENLIVVDMYDALLISKKWETSKLKNVIEELKLKSKIHTEFSNIVYRPWGSYTIIDEWIWFKTKRLSVLPWKKLSNQMHHHRSEHWVVVSWTAKVTIDNKEILLSKWQSTYIIIGSKHRLENIWKIDLHIIETQIWDYLEEDDIIRFDDEYWRI